MPSLRKLPLRVLRLAGKARVRLSQVGAPQAQRHPAGSRLARFRAYLAAEELSTILTHCAPRDLRLLDIGGAYGIHAGFFGERHSDLQVDVLDLKSGPFPLVHTGSYDSFEPEKPYDVIWASHVVEHLRNPGLFFDQAHRQLARNGWLCVTVPPMRSLMTLGHVSVWNGGLLLLHLVHAGFDCRQARVATYGYNVSVLVQKTNSPKLSKRERLPAVEQRGPYFEGDIRRLNWTVNQVEEICPGSWLHPARRMASHLSRSGFFKALDDRGHYRMHYFHSPTREVYQVA